jgi:hypothetical protein
MATYRKFRDIDYGKPIIAPTHGDTVAPQNDLAAAAWLPISATATNSDAGYFTYDYQRHVFTDKVVIMPGKLVALTRETLNGENATSSINHGTVGRLVPAGIRLAWKAAANDVAVLEYTAADVEERIEDLGTGLPVTEAKAYLKNDDGADDAFPGLNLTKQLRKRGLIGATETADALISRPIGVAANVVYAWAGGDGTQPKGLRFMNYRRENKSTFWTGQDHTLRLPVAPVTTGAEAVPAITTLVSTLAQLEAGTEGTGGGSADAKWLRGDQTVLATLLGARYADLDPTKISWVALALGTKSVESNVYNPLVVKSAAGVVKTAGILKKEKNSPSELKAPGDWFLDRDLGILFLYQAAGNAIPTGMVATDIVYFSYSAAPAVDTAGAPAKVFAAVTGAVKPGDYLACDKYSNFVPYIARPDETQDDTSNLVDWVDPTTFHRPEDIVGKCYTLDRSPKADLAAVKTFHDYEGVSLGDRTPGSANDGHPAEIHQSFGGQFAAIVRVLL